MRSDIPESKGMVRVPTFAERMGWSESGIRLTSLHSQSLRAESPPDGTWHTWEQTRKDVRLCKS